MNPDCAGLPEPSPVDVAIALARNPRRSFQRERCVKLLRRYFNLCAEVGRVPSMLGREIQVSHARVSYRRPSAFEDGVIFAIDIERCLDELDVFERGLIVRLVLQEHSEEDAARLLDCCRETVSRRLPQVLDKLYRILGRRHLLFRWKRRRPLAPTDGAVSINACDESSFLDAAQLAVAYGEDDAMSGRFRHLRRPGRETCIVAEDCRNVPVEILCQDLRGLSINACV